MTTHQLNLLAGISIAVCWCAFVATWLAAENYSEARVPAERTRSRFGTAVTPGLIIVTVISVAVPKADWHSLAVHAPVARILGLVFLMVATVFTIWARLVLASFGAARPRSGRSTSSAPVVRTASPGSPFTPESWACCSAPCWWPGAGDGSCPSPVFLVLLEIKIHIEERLMLAEFPAAIRRMEAGAPAGTRPVT